MELVTRGAVSEPECISKFNDFVSYSHFNFLLQLLKGSRSVNIQDLVTESMYSEDVTSTCER